MPIFGVGLIYLIGLVVSTSIAWTRLYYPNSAGLIERISFQAADPPWLPAGQVAKPLIGVHHFGDFELYLGWAKTVNPYIIDYPAQFLFTGKWLLFPLTLINHKTSFMFYVVISILILLFANYSLLRLVRKEVNLQIFGMYFILLNIITAPFLIDLDRGNLYSISIGAMALFVSKSLQKKYLSATIWLIIGVSFKPYFIYILVAMVFILGIKAWLGIFGGLIAANAASALLISSNYIELISNFVEANLRYNSAEAVGNILNSGSIVGWVLRIIEYFYGITEVNNFSNFFSDYFNLIGIAYILFAVVTWNVSKLPFYFRLLVLFSPISLSQASSQAYTWGWVSIVILIFVFEANVVKIKKINYILIGIFANLSLHNFWITLDIQNSYQRNYPQFLIIFPTIILIIISHLTLYRGQNNHFGRVSKDSKP